MKKIPLLAAFTIAFSCLTARAFSQDLNPVIGTALDKLKEIEKTDHIIEKTLFDYIYKDNSSKYEYNYKFYVRHAYNISVVGDESQGENENIKVYKIENGQWKVIRIYKTVKMNSTVLFTPEETGTYNVEISCTIKDNKDRACVGLIIDREN